MRHYPRKWLSQNFLNDTPIIEAILSAFNPQPEDNVVEIGPGLGALTQPLLTQLPQLTAIEIDKDLSAHLLKKLGPSLNLIEADALRVDYSQLGTSLRIIGNLPYHIGTLLLVRLLEYGAIVQDMHFMLQKEVVQRLVALPGTKAYGRLSVLAQYHCEVDYLFDVPSEAFYPRPKVASAVIRLTPYCLTPYAKVSLADLKQVLRYAFSMRRKTLANNVKAILDPGELTAVGIDPSLRPEQIGIEDYLLMTKLVAESCKI